MDADRSEPTAAVPPAPGGAYFDGASNRRRVVALELSDALEIREGGELLARWAYTN